MFGRRGKQEECREDKKERREKNIVRADSREQTVVSNKTASSV